VRLPGFLIDVAILAVKCILYINITWRGENGCAFEAIDPQSEKNRSGFSKYINEEVMRLFMLTGRGKNNAHNAHNPERPERPKVTLKDVAGIDEARQELGEILEFLRHPKKFHEMGARIPKGILLYGPPGTGKTLLARAIAGEAGVPFFSISGSNFVEMFVGVGASRVRDLFREAKKNAPSIIFIDEIDAVGRQRGAGVGGGHDEREQTLNQLLVEMDGFSGTKGIIVIAATNRQDILDPALLRSGRFDRRIMVDRPDVKGRQDILKVHTTGKPLADDVDQELIARRTPGFSGADIGNLVNEAVLLAIRRNKQRVEMNDFEEAVELVISGPERKSRVIGEKEKKLIAYHEAGHALVNTLLINTEFVHKVSIIQRGRAGGYTLLLPKDEHNYLTRSELYDQIKTLLGGRLAEILVLGEISTGARNDLLQAGEIARKMVCEYGMSEVIGPITLMQGEEPVFLGRDITRTRCYSEGFAASIDKEVCRIINTAYGQTQKLLQDHIDKLHRIARLLLEKETIYGDELRALLSSVSKPQVAATASCHDKA
jgi:cell division protease FtsH